MASASVVVADDSAAVRMLLVRMLEDHGCSLREAPSGESLLYECALRRPDLVISDIDLGDADGIEVGLRLLKNHPGLGIILMSGDPGNLDRARERGFQVVLGKPFNLEQVRASLARVLKTPPAVPFKP